MSKELGLPQGLEAVLSAEQILKRIRDMARQITADYAGKTLHAICVLENGFVFFSDLVRSLDLPVVCHFVKPYFSEKLKGSIATTEIFFSPELEVAGQDTLLVEGLLQTGVTTEFLMRNLLTRGAVSAKLAVLLDRQSQRKVALSPDYFGFILDSPYVVGYGLGGPQLGRNLPYVAAMEEPGPNPI